MYFKTGDEDTICALSTAPGAGGIAVIRVSGDKAASITRMLCKFLPECPESHKIYYGFLKSLVGESLDEVLVAYFAEGRSFTGEETVEISCHGGSVLVASIMKELVSAGCRTARRGEFTYRAFMNGRLDLVQAESVLGLIESQSQQSAKISLRQLQGHLSSEFRRIEDDLLWLLAHLEASIDFSTEGIEVVPSEHLVDRTQGLIDFVGKMISSYGRGRALREGLQAVLVGRPNAGKSSLLNAFVKEDRAIVTAHAGTTRDLVEGRITVNGVPLTFVDTAGLREAEHEVEKIGIERSRSAMEKADLVFFVVDASTEDWQNDLREFAAQVRPNSYFLLNKVDQPSVQAKRREVAQLCESLGISDRVYWVSAATSEGLDRVEAMLSSHVESLSADTSNVLTQARHLELLRKIQACLGAALRLIKEDSSPEFIAFELQESIRAIHELLGKEFNEQIIDRIFKEFCLGK